MKKIAALISISLLSAPSLAEYVTRAPIGLSIGTWSDIVEYSDWTDTGSNYSCTYSSPQENTINYGEEFTQIGSCFQKQLRTKYTYQVSDIDSSRKNEATYDETRVISVESSRISTGTLNYIVSTTSKTEVSSTWSSYSGCRQQTGSAYKVFNGAVYFDYTAKMAGIGADIAHAENSNMYSIYRQCTYVYPKTTTVTNIMADGTNTSTTTITGSESTYKFDKINVIDIKNGLYTYNEPSSVVYDVGPKMYTAWLDGNIVYSGTSRSALQSAGYDISSLLYTQYNSSGAVYSRTYKIKKL